MGLVDWFCWFFSTWWLRFGLLRGELFRLCWDRSSSGRHFLRHCTLTHLPHLRFRTRTFRDPARDPFAHLHRAALLALALPCTTAFHTITAARQRSGSGVVAVV
jgi:hypothetical protein